MLNWQIGVKDLGVKNLMARAMIALQFASRETAEQMMQIMSDEMKFYAPVFHGVLKASIGKYEPQWIQAGGSATEAKANSIFRLHHIGSKDWMGEVGTSLFYAKWVNYGYTIDEDRVVSFRIGGTQEFRTLRAGTHQPGLFMLEKGVDAARIRYPRVLNKNVRTALTKAQRSTLSASSYRPRIKGKFVSRYG